MKESPSVYQNKLFAAMPLESRERLIPHLRLVSLKSELILSASNLTSTYVYFPIDVIIALVYVLDNGASSAVSLIGNEGLVGVFSLMSDQNSSLEALVMSSGYAFSLPRNKMQTEFNSHDCGILMLRYIQSLFAQMSQTAVCNRHHAIDQQLCRLLLLSLDRSFCSHLTLTHDLIARMLGVRRGGVSEAAARLQSAGVIDYHRGHINILDRARLEAMTCECYSVVKKETGRLFPSLDAPPECESSRPLFPGAEPGCLLCFKNNNCTYLKNKKLEANNQN